MLKLLLFKLWPAVVPILLYLAYRLVTPKKDDAVLEAKRTSHWPYVILLSIIISATIILYTVVTLPAGDIDGGYQPTELRDGELIRESVRGE